MKKKYLGIILLVFLFTLQPQMTESLISTDSTSAFKGSNLAEPAISKSIGIGGEEHLITNMIPNSGMESYEADGRPRDFTSNGDGYEMADAAYTGNIHAGSHSGRVRALGTDQFSATGSLYRSASSSALLTQGVYLDLWYNCLSNPDLLRDESHFVYVRLRDDILSQNYYFHYMLSFTGAAPPNNTLNRYAYFDLNTTLSTWTHLQRNVTEDFYQVFGSVNPNVYFSYVYFYARSPTEPTGYSEFLIDEVSLTNNTAYDYFSINGNFDLGTGSAWSESNANPSYIYATDDHISGSKAVNMTATTGIDGGYSSINLYRYFTDWDYPPGGFFATDTGTVVIDFDWKFTDSTGTEEYAYLYFYGYNETLQYQLNIWLSHSLDILPISNYSTSGYKEIHIEASNFGNRGIWNHYSVDVYTLMQSLGLTNVPIVQFRFQLNSGDSANLKTELLIDNFEVQAYPTMDPYFEVDYHWSATNQFMGWSEDDLVDYSNITTDSHSGNWAANLTSYDGYGRVDIYRDMFNFDIEATYYTDFWWKINEHVPGSSTTSSMVWFTLDGGYSLYYILGATSGFSANNNSDTVYYYVDDFNTTGVWNNLARNIIDDLNAFFTPMEWNMTGLYLISQCYGTGGKISTIFDDIHFVEDTHGPEIISYQHLNPPTYYEDAL
ncbi:MAG: hypothetical protein FK732_12820, partial [Asgard group archaeon]|nr:hypothetical protein [Asgard group archaeon]